MKKYKIILITAIVLGGTSASLVIGHQAGIKLRENDAVLRQQEELLAQLAAQQRHLSNRLAQVGEPATLQYPTAELKKLHLEAEALRRRTNELQKSSSPRPQESQSFSNRLARLQEHNREYFDPGHIGKINDARSLCWALGRYALLHQDTFPSNVDQITPFPKSGWPPDVKALTGTNQFEIVYQGSRNELTNVPLREVTVLRERQPWLTSNGKWARVYGTADGLASIVESDDNFQSWEAAHVVPPPSGSQ